MEICQHLSKTRQLLSTLDIITITEQITGVTLVEATKKKANPATDVEPWRTETMVLPDYKVGIAEQSQGC